MLELIDKILNISNLINNSLNLSFTFDVDNDIDIYYEYINNKNKFITFDINCFESTLNIKKRGYYVIIENTNLIKYLIKNDFTNFFYSIYPTHNYYIPNIISSNKIKNNVSKLLDEFSNNLVNKISFKLKIPFVNINQKNNIKINDFIISEIVYYNQLLSKYLTIFNKYFIEIYDEFDILTFEDIDFIIKRLLIYNINFNTIIFSFNIYSEFYISRYSEIVKKLTSSGIYNLSFIFKNYC
jgi:hypothetical protein